MNGSAELESESCTSHDTIDVNQPTTSENQPTTSENQPTTSENQPPADDGANERSPLLFTTTPRRSFISRAVLDHIYITCLSVFVVVALSIGIYLLIVEGRREDPDRGLVTTRDSWINEKTSSNLTKLVPPIKKVLLLHTITERCWTPSECTELLRRLRKEQEKYIDEPDIMYSFMIGDDDRIYEGRGWNYQSSFHNDDGDTISVAFLGYYRNIAPTAQQAAALEALLSFGVYTDYLVPCYEITTLTNSFLPHGIKILADEIQEKVKKLNKC